MSHAVSVCHGSFGRAAVYELDKPIITHAHREGHLIIYLGGASSRVMVGDTNLHLDADRAVAVSPWEPHSFHPDQTAAKPCICLVLYIKPIWFLENSPSAEFSLSFGAPQLRITPQIGQWVRRLTGLLLDDDRRDLFDGMLFETTRSCFESSWSCRPPAEPLIQARWRFSDHRVRRSIRLMQESFSAETEMETLAREVGLSRPHFFKLFKKQMGVTPNVYLNTLRSEQAIGELLESDKTVTEIAYDLGFSSQASFTRFFATNVGIAPSEYRRVAHIF